MSKYANNYTSAYPAITEVFSRERDNLVLMYGNSNDRTYNALAFQILRTVRRIERVENAFSLADDETKSFGYFGTGGFSADTSAPGNEVFSIDAARANTIIEYGFSVPVDGVYVGVQVGDGDTVNGLAEGSDRDRGYSAEDLRDRGGVLSDLTYLDSPTPSINDGVPTTALSETPRQGIFRIDSERDGDNPFYFAFDNQSGGAADIDVNGYGMAYEVRVVPEREKVKSMVAGKGYDRRLCTYGGFGNTNPNLPREWYDAVVTLGYDELGA